LYFLFNQGHIPIHQNYYFKNCPNILHANNLTGVQQQCQAYIENTEQM